MLDRLIHRQRSARRAFALSVILAICLLLTADAVIVGSFHAVGWVAFAFACANPFVQLALQSRWGRGPKSKKSPLRQVESFGDPVGVLATIDAEIAAGRDVRVFGRTVVWDAGFAPDLVLVTPTWLIQANRDGLTLVRLDDILWLSRFRRLSRNIYWLPRRTRGFRVCLRSEEVKEFPIADTAEADAILDELLRRRPELCVGFDESCRELLSGGPERMAGEVEQRRVEWSALEADGRERWRVEQRAAVDATAQYLSGHVRDAVRVALDTAAWTRRGRTGSPPDSTADTRVSKIMTAESNFFFRALVVWLVMSVLLLLLTICTHEERFTPSTSKKVLSILTTAAILAVGWGGFAYWFAYRLPGFRLGRLLRRRGNAERLIGKLDVDLQYSATRWLHGRWLGAFVYPQSDFIALGAKWLLQMRPGHAALILLTDLVWVHERVVPTALWWLDDRYRFELAGRLRDGSAVKVRLDDEAEFAELLEELLERRPALMTGWRGDWLALLEAGPGALADAYDGREHEYGALSPEKREVWLDESFDLFHRFVENVE